MPLISPKGARAANNETIKVGLIGCGGRGTGAARQALNADKNAQLTAMADVFEDRLQRSHKTLKDQDVADRVRVDSDHQFIGLDAYQKVIDSVDLVILTTPPGFRPIQFEAAVEANKHIFLEKPMATDAPGLRKMIAAAEKAKEKELAVVNGFCWRKNFARRAFYEEIHNGIIGDIRAIYATYYTGPVRPMPSASERPEGWSDVAWQLRHWINFVWLSGDSILEQACHSVDKIAWGLQDQHPTKVVGVGGRQVPAKGGNIFDHFEVNYEFGNGVRGFMGSRQQSGCYNENNDYIIGAEGTGYIEGWGVPYINDLKGNTIWKYTGPRNDMYQTEHNELFASIRKGKPLWEGDWMCSSTLMALMGRMASYTGQEITWDMAMNSEENLYPENLKWDMEHEVQPMARPGKTEFV